MKTSIASAALVLATGAALLPATAAAQSASDSWKFNAIIYGYFPDIGGETTFPAGGTSVSVDSSKIIGNLKFAFMGTFEAKKGRFGLLADLLYMDVNGSVTNTRDVSVGGHDLPASVSTNLDLGVKGTVFELAGTYSLLDDPATKLDVLGGARYLDVKQTLTYSFSADVGPIIGPGRSATVEAKDSYLDAIIGAKGQFLFGDRRQWFVPWYADVGTGESKLTYQVLGGLGYSFSWGQVLAAWRYVDWNFKSGSKIESLNFNGPMVGVAFNW